MYTRVKTDEEIQAMRVGGKMLAEVLEILRGKVTEGISTYELDQIAAKELKSRGGEAAFLGYAGFPASVCISVNDEVVHGIPKKETVIKDGDIVSMDFGVRFKGMIVDSAISVLCGKGTPQTRDLLKYTEQSLVEGLAVIKHGAHVGDIGFAIERILNIHKFGIVRDLVGHGVGHEVHEDPNIPNYGRRNTGPQLARGMTLAIEPMATLGRDAVKIGSDGWTVNTADKSMAAHFEHTVLVTDDGCEILTLAQPAP